MLLELKINHLLASIDKNVDYKRESKINKELKYKNTKKNNTIKQTQKNEQQITIQTCVCKTCPFRLHN